MKKLYIVLALLVTIFLVAACAEPKTTTTTPTTETNTPTITAVCGDGECDSEEMCNINTLETPCQADCGPCPSSLYAEEFECGDANCVKSTSNAFTIKIPSSIKVNIANLGETIANTMEVGFKCYENNNRVVQHVRLMNYKGVVYADSFDNGDDTIRLTAKGTDTSKTVYTLNLKKWEQESIQLADLTCNFEFPTHSPMKNKEQTVSLTITE